MKLENWKVKSARKLNILDIWMTRKHKLLLFYVFCAIIFSLIEISLQYKPPSAMEAGYVYYILNPSRR